MALLYTSLQSRRAPCCAVRVLVLVVCLFGLGACGKKPPQVDPPFTAGTQTFPRVYPDSSTDPAP